MPQDSGVRNCGEIEEQVKTIADEIAANLEAKSAEKKERMNGEISALQDEMPDTSGVDAAVQLDFKVDWKDTEILIPWVEFTVRQKEIKMDLPQVKMSNKEFIFHTPSVRMVNKKVGQYPEFKCSGLKCTVKWSDIITKVPETFMEEQRVVMGIPEFWVDTTSVLIPELLVDFSQKRIVLGLPQFTLTDIKVKAGEIKDKSQDIATRYENEFKEMAADAESNAKARTSSKVHELFDCHRANVQLQRDSTLQSIEAQIQSARVNLELAKSKGVGDAVNQIESVVSQLGVQKQQIEKQFSAMLDELNAKEKQTISQLVDEDDT
jgi:vacuolar-type H+-ATPase subunit E/Vma4